MQIARIFAIAAFASASYVAASSSVVESPLENISPAAKAYIKQLEAEFYQQKNSIDSRSINGRGQKPVIQRDINNECSVGNVQCCNQVVNDSQKKKTLAGLLGLNDVVGEIGLNCDNLPINVIGGAISASNYCKSSPVCCNNVTQNGLVNIGCTALPIN